MKENAELKSSSSYSYTCIVGLVISDYDIELNASPHWGQKYGEPPSDLGCQSRTTIPFCLCGDVVHRI